MNEFSYPRIGETVLRETLPNGLEVCIVPKPQHCRQYAFFATRYGGMDMHFCLDGEWKDTPAGIAHYLEHKMFDTQDGNALQHLSQMGAEPNAFTSNAMTGYYFDCTDHFLDNLRILLSFVSIPYFTEESVEKERGIIGQEIRMVEDNPDWVVYMNLLKAMYEQHPIRTAIAGTVESISEIQAETLYACHKAFYTPSNMILCVVGNVNPSSVLDVVKELLPKEGGSSIARDYGAEKETVVNKYTETTMEVSMPQFLLGFKCDTVADGDNLLRQSIIGSMACDILFSESASLYTKLYEAHLINGSFEYSFDQLPGASYLYVGGESRNPNAVSAEIMQEIQRVLEEGVDEELYQQIRCASFGQSLRSLNSFENIAVSLVDGYFRKFDAFHFPELYESVTKKDIEGFIRNNLTEERCAMSVVQPKEA